MTKQVIQRNLPLTDKYQVKSIHRVGAEGATGCVCANCGAVLVNHANIINQKGEKFIVGLDCMKTLVTNLVNVGDYEQYLYEFNSNSRFVALLPKAVKITHNDHMIYIEHLNSKDRTQYKSAFKRSLREQGFIEIDKYLTDQNKQQQ